MIGAIQYDDPLIERQLFFLFKELLNLCATRFGGVVQIAAVDLHDEVGKPLHPELPDRAQQQLHALDIDKLAKETKAIAPHAVVDEGKSVIVVALPVGDMGDLA